MKLGLGSDPGAFFLGRPGLYIRELGIVVIFLVFKGNDLHSGFAPSVDPEAERKWLLETRTLIHTLHVMSGNSANRAGYVLYPSRPAIHRQGTMAITKSTTFGNAGHGVSQKVAHANYADDGQHIMEEDALANRLAREAQFQAHNYAQLTRLEVTTKIKIRTSKGRHIHPEPLPFNPIADASVVSWWRGRYKWLYADAQNYVVHLSKSSYKSNILRLTQAPDIDDDGALPERHQVPRFTTARSSEQLPQNNCIFSDSPLSSVSSSPSSLPSSPLPATTQSGMDVSTDGQAEILLLQAPEALGSTLVGPTPLTPVLPSLVDQSPISPSYAPERSRTPLFLPSTPTPTPSLLDHMSDHSYTPQFNSSTPELMLSEPPSPSNPNPTSSASLSQAQGWSHSPSPPTHSLMPFAPINAHTSSTNPITLDAMLPISPSLILSDLLSPATLDSMDLTSDSTPTSPSQLPTMSHFFPPPTSLLPSLSKSSDSPQTGTSAADTTPSTSSSRSSIPMLENGDKPNILTVDLSSNPNAPISPSIRPNLRKRGAEEVIDDEELDLDFDHDDSESEFDYEGEEQEDELEDSDWEVDGSDSHSKEFDVSGIIDKRVSVSQL